MSFSSFINRFFGRDDTETSKNMAKERLRLVLVHDRLDVSEKVMNALRVDLINVIGKYFGIDEKALEVSLSREADGIALVANIPIRRQIPIAITLPEPQLKSSDAEGQTADAEGKATAAAVKQEPAPFKQEPAPSKQEPAPPKQEPALPKQESAPSKPRSAPSKQGSVPSKQKSAPPKQESAPPKQESAAAKKDGGKQNKGKKNKTPKQQLPKNPNPEQAMEAYIE